MNSMRIIPVITILLSSALSFAISPADQARMRSCREVIMRLGIPLKEVKVDPNRIQTTELEDGRLRITVHHELLRGLSAEQTDWWFRNMANSIPSRITDIKPYVLLDKDHVSIDSQKNNAHGELQLRSRIQFHEELKSGDKSFSVKEDFLISKIGPGILEFTKDKMFGIPLGIELVTIKRTYTEVEGGVNMTTVFTAGIANHKFSGVIRPINRFLIGRLFSPARQEAWKAHTVAEIGALESFLPWLLAHWNSNNLN